MQPQDRYTYQNAGFNGFMARSLKSNAGANSVADGIATGSGKAMNFDLQQAFGSLGNKIQIGRIILDGVNGRVIAQDETATDTAWFGNLI